VKEEAQRKTSPWWSINRKLAFGSGSHFFGWEIEIGFFEGGKIMKKF
jgi:hypothetical protein